MLPGKCLHQIFETRAREGPDRPAVRMSGEQITYAELDRRANQLAQRLRMLGVGPDVLVGLCLDRSIHAIVGMLAILKANGAYVPIDPTYPANRVRFLLADSAVRVVVTLSHLAKLLESYQATIICIDDEDSWPVPSAVVQELKEDSEGNLAYVIYTSGSTGTPKGVLVEHRNVVRLFEQTEHWFEFDEHDVWTMFHSISFDFSVWEVWGALLYGGCVVIVQSEVTHSPEQFYALLTNEGITVLSQTPTAFRQLTATALVSESVSNAELRLIVFGGEALELKLLKPWIDRFGDQRPALVNMYGITETTVHVTYKRIRKEDLERPGLSPIGVPIADLQIYLLDEAGRPVPDGVPGEIYVGGAGLARGYLNAPELTARSFMQRINGGSGVTRLYHSGDRAIRLPSGEFSYLGRSDDQIKVRGFRIEPGEIESCICSHPQVTSAIVIDRDYGDGDVRLIAYVIPNAGFSPSERSVTQLSNELSDRARIELPIHMRPFVYCVVAEFPMTNHGKVDRQALRQLPAEPGVFESNSPARLTPTEQVVLGIWESVLQRAGIKTQDDFFDLGGTSLALMRIFGSVNQHFGIMLNASILAEEATIERLARSVDELLKNNCFQSSENKNAGDSRTISVLS